MNPLDSRNGVVWSRNLCKVPTAPELRGRNRFITEVNLLNLAETELPAATYPEVLTVTLGPYTSNLAQGLWTQMRVSIF